MAVIIQKKAAKKYKKRKKKSWGGIHVSSLGEVKCTQM